MKNKAVRSDAKMTIENPKWRKENMKVLDAEFVQGFIRMANDGWEQGWLRERAEIFPTYPAGRSGSRKGRF